MVYFRSNAASSRVISTFLHSLAACFKADKLIVAMKKPAVILDKSFLQELCLLPAPKCSNFLTQLEGKVQFVFPPILIEEVLASARGMQPPYPAEILAMGRVIYSGSKFWMEDIYEVAFRELVCGEQFIGPNLIIPMAPAEYKKRVSEISLQNPETTKWMDERKASLKATRKQWRQGHAEYRNYKPVSYTDDAQLFESLRRHFALCLSNDALRNEFLENVFGDRFRLRHLAEKKAIASAFQSYTEKSFAQYPVTTMLLFVRHIYWLGAVSPVGENAKTRANFLAMDADNFADADYVASAQLCDQLLTRDEGMFKVIGMIQRGNLWPGGHIVYMPNEGNFEQQLDAYLKA